MKILPQGFPLAYTPVGRSVALRAYGLARSPQEPRSWVLATHPYPGRGRSLSGALCRVPALAPSNQLRLEPRAHRADVQRQQVRGVTGVCGLVQNAAHGDGQSRSIVCLEAPSRVQRSGGFAFSGHEAASTVLDRTVAEFFPSWNTWLFG